MGSWDISLILATVGSIGTVAVLMLIQSTTLVQLDFSIMKLLKLVTMQPMLNASELNLKCSDKGCCWDYGKMDIMAIILFNKYLLDWPKLQII